MPKISIPMNRASRRDVLTGVAASSASLAVGLPAPAVLAQTRTPIKLGILNSFTGSIAYTAEHSLNAMTMYFESIGWTIAGRKVELIKEDDQLNPQVGLGPRTRLQASVPSETSWSTAAVVPAGA